MATLGNFSLYPGDNSGLYNGPLTRNPHFRGTSKVLSTSAADGLVVNIRVSDVVLINGCSRNALQERPGRPGCLSWGKSKNQTRVAAAHPRAALGTLILPQVMHLAEDPAWSNQTDTWLASRTFKQGWHKVLMISQEQEVDMIFFFLFARSLIFMPALLRNWPSVYNTWQHITKLWKKKISQPLFSQPVIKKKEEC